MNNPSLPKSREGAWLWMFKIFAGLMIVLILAIHFIVNHLVAPNGLLSYADVIRYYDNPIIPAMEIVFLVLVVSHALVGMRSIILDLNPSGRTLRLVDAFLMLLGSISIIYGTWLVFVIAAR